MTLARGWGKNSIYSAVGQISTFGFTSLLCNCSEIQLYRERQCTLYVLHYISFLTESSLRLFYDEKHYIFKRGADFEWVHSAREVFIKPWWTTCKCELSFVSLEHSRQSLKCIFLQVIALKEKRMGFLFYCLFVPLLKRSSTSVTQQ